MILINTTNPLKKKAVNRVLNISDDKLEEVINILELLNFPEITNEDIYLMKFYILGRSGEKQKNK